MVTTVKYELFLNIKNEKYDEKKNISCFQWAMDAHMFF
jgi:hypothetical protein